MILDLLCIFLFIFFKGLGTLFFDFASQLGNEIKVEHFIHELPLLLPFRSLTTEDSMAWYMFKKLHPGMIFFESKLSLMSTNFFNHFWAMKSDKRESPDIRYHGIIVLQFSLITLQAVPRLFIILLKYFVPFECQWVIRVALDSETCFFELSDVIIHQFDWFDIPFVDCDEQQYC